MHKKKSVKTTFLILLFHSVTNVYKIYILPFNTRHINITGILGKRSVMCCR